MEEVSKEKVSEGGEESASSPVDAVSEGLVQGLALLGFSEEGRNALREAEMVSRQGPVPVIVMMVFSLGVYVLDMVPDLSVFCVFVPSFLRRKSSPAQVSQFPKPPDGRWTIWFLNWKYPKKAAVACPLMYG